MNKFFKVKKTDFKMNLKWTERLVGELELSSLILPVLVFFVTTLVFLFLPLVEPNFPHYNILLAFKIILGLDLLFFLVSLLLADKYKVNPKYNKLYEREVYNNYAPAHVRVLIENGRVDATSITGTLIDLIDRNILGIKREDSREEENILNIFKAEGEVFIYLKRDYANLISFEQYLIKWFIEELGNGKEVSMSAIKEGLAKTEYPGVKFASFKQLVYDTFPVDEFLKQNDKMIIFNRILLLSIAILWIGSMFISKMLPPIVIYYCFNIGAGIIFLNPPAIVFNQKAIDERSRYWALKRYIKDFSDMNSAEPESVMIWDKYLVYAVIFEIAKEVKDDIERFYGKDIYRMTNNVVYKVGGDK